MTLRTRLSPALSESAGESDARALRNYILVGNYRVQGWLEPEVLWVSRALAAEQAKSRVLGSVVEIGVHHGRFFIGLRLTRNHFLAADSTTLSAADITERVGPVRMFSVDGGHTAEIVEHDMTIAAASLTPGASSSATTSSTRAGPAPSRERSRSWTGHPRSSRSQSASTRCCSATPTMPPLTAVC